MYPYALLQVSRSEFFVQLYQNYVLELTQYCLLAVEIQYLSNDLHISKISRLRHTSIAGIRIQ